MSAKSEQQNTTLSTTGQRCGFGFRWRKRKLTAADAGRDLIEGLDVAIVEMNEVIATDD
jgi:hypothetical protein